MFSRGLYEAFFAFSGGVYSNGRPIPRWDRPPSPASERDERIWSELAAAATFAVETRQQIAAIEPGKGAAVGGAFVIRAAGELESPFNVYRDSSRTVMLARFATLDLATELLLQRYVAATVEPTAPIVEPPDGQ